MVQQIQKSNHIDNLGERLTAFTAVNSEKAADESKWAKKVVDKYGMKWIKAECTSNNLIELLPEIIYYQDAPLVSTSTYAQFKVMEAAKEQKIQVLIDGQGGDELFGGYPPFYTSLYLELIRNARFSHLINEINYLKNSSFSLGIFSFSSIKILNEAFVPNFIRPFWAGIIRPEAKYFEGNFWKEHSQSMTLSKEYTAQPLNELLAEYFSGYYLKNLLRWEDRCSMRFSIESRTPFSDDLPLIEKCFSIPSIFKIHDGWNKSLLRNSMTGILPNEIQFRSDKMGFTTPQNIWLQESNAIMKKMIAQLPDKSNFVNKDKLLKNWKIIYSDRNEKLKSFTFRYLNYLLWQQKFGLS
jgi:asparagine synthase (glutamine-hydrolysing)